MRSFNPKNILIVRTDRIGDVVLTSTVISPLKRAFPEMKITMLVAPVTVDLVKGHPGIDEVLVDDRRGEHKGVFGFLRLTQLLRQKKFDMALVLHTKKRTNALCFFAGIPQRVGYKNEKFGFLLNVPLEDKRHLGQKHEAELCLEVLSIFGIEEKNLETFVPVQLQAEKWADQFLRDNHVLADTKLIAVHPGASDPAKCWPAEQFAQAMEQLSKKYKCCFVLVGGKEELELGDRIAKLLSFPLINLSGQTSVAQLVSLLKRCQLLISNDSGPVHVAAALKTPVLSIFTRNLPGINPSRWRPLGPRSSYVSGAPGETKPIRTEEVVQAVDALLKLC